MCLRDPTLQHRPQRAAPSGAVSSPGEGVFFFPAELSSTLMDFELIPFPMVFEQHVLEERASLFTWGLALDKVSGRVNLVMLLSAVAN